MFNLLLCSLMSSVANNNKDRLERLIYDHEPSLADINDALHFAAEVGKEHSLAALLEHVSRGNHVVNEAFITASRNGHLEAVRVLQRYHADINYTDRFKGMTAVMVACQQGHHSVLTHLIRSGCDLNIKTVDKDFTALHFAALNDHAQCIQIILKKRRLPDECNYGNNSVLKAAALCGNEASVAMLLRYGAFVTRDAVEAAALQNHHGCVQLMLHHHHALHDDLEFQTSLIVRILLRNYKETAEVLLESGFRGDMIHPETMHTPLGLVSRKGLLDMVDLLINHGINIDGLGNYDATALMISCAVASTDVIRRLIQHGCNVNFINKYGKSAVHYCVEGENGDRNRNPAHIQCLLLLLQNGANPDAYTSQTHMQSFQREDMLIVTPLYSALLFRNHTLIKILLRANCNIDLDAYFLHNVMSFKPWKFCIHHSKNVRTTALKMLFIAGLHVNNDETRTIPDEKLEQMPWFLNLIRTPRSLKHLSRSAIRNSRHVNSENVGQLPVPVSVQRYLNLEELDWITEGGYQLDKL